MLKRQSLWVPVLKHNPAFLKASHMFLAADTITKLSATSMNIKPEDMHVALTPDTRHPEKQVAALMAFPVTITPQACDHFHNYSHSEKPVLHRELAFGCANTVCDSYNSFHIMERLLPHFNPHVSVNIQSQQMRPLREGEQVLVVSTIDKLGKRLVYCKTEFFVEPPAEAITAEMVEREKNLKSVDDLKVALSYYEKVLSGTHVKSILPEMEHHKTYFTK